MIRPCTPHSGNMDREVDSEVSSLEGNPGMEDDNVTSFSEEYSSFSDSENPSCQRENPSKSVANESQNNEPSNNETKPVDLCDNRPAGEVTEKIVPRTRYTKLYTMYTIEDCYYTMPVIPSRGKPSQVKKKGTETVVNDKNKVNFKKNRKKKVKIVDGNKENKEVNEDLRVPTVERYSPDNGNPHNTSLPKPESLKSDVVEPKPSSTFNPTTEQNSQSSTQSHTSALESQLDLSEKLLAEAKLRFSDQRKVYKEMEKEGYGVLERGVRKLLRLRRHNKKLVKEKSVLENGNNPNIIKNEETATTCNTNNKLNMEQSKEVVKDDASNDNMKLNSDEMMQSNDSTIEKTGNNLDVKLITFKTDVKIEKSIKIDTDIIADHVLIQTKTPIKYKPPKTTLHSLRDRTILKRKVLKSALSLKFDNLDDLSVNKMREFFTNKQLAKKNNFNNDTSNDFNNPKQDQITKDDNCEVSNRDGIVKADELGKSDKPKANVGSQIQQCSSTQNVVASNNKVSNKRGNKFKEDTTKMTAKEAALNKSASKNNKSTQDSINNSSVISSSKIVGDKKQSTAHFQAAVQQKDTALKTSPDTVVSKQNKKLAKNASHLNSTLKKFQNENNRKFSNRKIAELNSSNYATTLTQDITEQEKHDKKENSLSKCQKGKRNKNKSNETPTCCLPENNEEKCYKASIITGSLTSEEKEMAKSVSTDDVAKIVQIKTVVEGYFQHNKRNNDDSANKRKNTKQNNNLNINTNCGSDSKVDEVEEYNVINIFIKEKRDFFFHPSTRLSLKQDNRDAKNRITHDDCFRCAFSSSRKIIETKEFILFINEKNTDKREDLNPSKACKTKKKSRQSRDKEYKNMTKYVVLVKYMRYLLEKFGAEDIAGKVNMPAYLHDDIFEESSQKFEFGAIYQINIQDYISQLEPSNETDSEESRGSVESVVFDDMAPSTEGKEVFDDFVTSSTEGKQVFEDIVTPSTQSKEVFDDFVTPSTEGKEVFDDIVTPSTQVKEVFDDFVTSSTEGKEVFDDILVPSFDGKEGSDDILLSLEKIETLYDFKLDLEEQTTVNISREESVRIEDVMIPGELIDIGREEIFIDLAPCTEAENVVACKADELVPVSAGSNMETSSTDNAVTTVSYADADYYAVECSFPYKQRKYYIEFMVYFYVISFHLLIYIDGTAERKRLAQIMLNIKDLFVSHEPLPFEDTHDISKFENHAFSEFSAPAVSLMISFDKLMRHVLLNDEYMRERGWNSLEKFHENQSVPYPKQWERILRFERIFEKQFVSALNGIKIDIIELNQQIRNSHEPQQESAKGTSSKPGEKYKENTQILKAFHYTIEKFDLSDKKVVELFKISTQKRSAKIRTVITMTPPQYDQVTHAEIETYEKPVQDNTHIAQVNCANINKLNYLNVLVKWRAEHPEVMFMNSRVPTLESSVLQLYTNTGVIGETLIMGKVFALNDFTQIAYWARFYLCYAVTLGRFLARNIPVDMNELVVTTFGEYTVAEELQRSVTMSYALNEFTLAVHALMKDDMYNLPKARHFAECFKRFPNSRVDSPYDPKNYYNIEALLNYLKCVMVTTRLPYSKKDITLMCGLLALREGDMPDGLMRTMLEQFQLQGSTINITNVQYGMIYQRYGHSIKYHNRDDDVEGDVALYVRGTSQVFEDLPLSSMTPFIAVGKAMKYFKDFPWTNLMMMVKREWHNYTTAVMRVNGRLTPVKPVVSEATNYNLYPNLAYAAKEILIRVGHEEVLKFYAGWTDLNVSNKRFIDLIIDEYICVKNDDNVLLQYTLNLTEEEVRERDMLFKLLDSFVYNSAFDASDFDCTHVEVMLSLNEGTYVGAWINRAVLVENRKKTVAFLNRDHIKPFTH